MESGIIVFYFAKINIYFGIFAFMIDSNIRNIKSELPSNVKLVAVSKYRPLEDLMQAYEAGQRVFAESRPLELEAKAKAMPGDCEWHFIGHLQTNKLRNVLPYVSLIHSVDSFHLLEAIQKANAAAGRTTDVLLEVHVAREESKQGFDPSELQGLALVEKLQGECGNVRLRGLMAMASNTDDLARVDADFAAAQQLFESIRRDNPSLTDFDQLSIGMSGDWPAALRHGATMVRIGSAIFVDNQ